MQLISIPVAGQAMKLFAWIPYRTKVYIRVLGPGNIRIGTDKELLEQSRINGSNEGLPQSIADAEREREWVGALWVTTDTPNCVVVGVCPALDMVAEKARQGIGR